MRSHKSSERAALAWLASILDIVFLAHLEYITRTRRDERECFMSPHGWERHMLWLPFLCALEVIWSHFYFSREVLTLLWKTDLFGINCSCQLREPSSDTSLSESHLRLILGTPLCNLLSTCNTHHLEQSMLVEPGKPVPAVPPTSPLTWVRRFHAAWEHRTYCPLGISSSWT